MQTFLRGAGGACTALTFIAIFASTALAQSGSAQCGYIPNRADYQRAWEEVISDKRMALDQGIGELRAIAARLREDRNAEIGAPGSGKEAGIALALVVRETTDLIGRMANAFKVKATPEQKRARDTIRTVRQTHEAEKKAAGELVARETRPLIDKLPTFIPGIRMARDIRDWEAAKSEINRQLAAVEQAIREADRKLLALGGPERAYSIDALVQKAQARSPRCDAKPERAATPMRSAPAMQRPLAGAPSSYGRRGPGSDSACGVLGTCDD